MAGDADHYEVVRGEVRREIGQLEDEIRALRTDLTRLSAVKSVPSAGAPRPRTVGEDHALVRTANVLRTEIAGLRAEGGPGFAQKAFENFGLSPALLKQSLVADAERRRAVEDELLQLVSDADVTLRRAVLAERAAREEGERRLLRYAADLATILRAELDAERSARKESGRLRARLSVLLADAGSRTHLQQRPSETKSPPALAL